MVLFSVETRTIIMCPLPTGAPASVDLVIAVGYQRFKPSPICIQPHHPLVSRTVRPPDSGLNSPFCSSLGAVSTPGRSFTTSALLEARRDPGCLQHRLLPASSAGSIREATVVVGLSNNPLMLRRPDVCMQAPHVQHLFALISDLMLLL